VAHIEGNGKETFFETPPPGQSNKKPKEIK
jgi:hypothetical protein